MRLAHPWAFATVAAWLAAGAAEAPAATVSVTISSLTFSPAEISVHVGDTIEWTNKDFVAHTATARNKDWDVTIAPGKAALVKVTRAGAVDYFCRFHPNMTGHITVAE
ncbi:cupredoxin family copper-binding protein [soil metagenome]